MSIFNYYSTVFKGSLSESIVNSFEVQALDIIEMYIKSKCLNKTKELNDYGDFNKAICYEIELLNLNGVGSINGASSENDVTSIKTGNYEIQISANRRNKYIWNGLPLHTMAKMLIDNELKKNGHSSILVRP